MRIALPLLGSWIILSNIASAVIVHGTQIGVAASEFDRFGGDQNFIGAGISWSSIGRPTTVSPSPSEVDWATLISPRYFITAAHEVSDGNGSANKTLRFYPGNTSSSFVDLTIDHNFGVNIGHDLHLGRFTTAAPSNIKPVSILAVPEITDYVGQELYLIGNNPAAPLNTPLSLSQRVGRNVYESTGGPSDEKVTFAMSATRADLDNDNIVDNDDWDILLANFGQTGSLEDGDINGDGDIDIDDATWLYKTRTAIQSNTRGFIYPVNRPADEAIVQDGDSGGPSFSVTNGIPALLGTHYSGTASSLLGYFANSSSDNALSIHREEIAAEILSASSGAETAVFSSAFRGNQYTARTGVQRPTGLQTLNALKGDLNGDMMVTAADIDLITKEVRAVAADATRPFSLALDLNSDNSLTSADRLIFIEDVIGTHLGDLNLDGVVNQDDIDEATGNANMQNAGWGDGDFNGNGSVGFLSDITPASALAQANNNAGTRGRWSINVDFAGDDGELTADDIDALTEEIRDGTDDPSFDLDLDGTVDGDDYDIYITDVFGTVVGDVNFDGIVNSHDYISASASTDGGWRGGDLDGDGDVEPSGIVPLFSSEPDPPDYPRFPVPEPSATLFLVVGFLTARLSWPRQRAA